jgi:uncharacterized protein YqeY
MSLEQRIDEDYVQAMRSGDRARRDTLRFLRAALKNALIEARPARTALDDEAVTKVLQHQAKMRRDSIEQFERGGRQDLVAAERTELGIIESYLPKGLTPEEIEAAARRVIAEVGATSPAQMGTVMKQLMSEVGGRADGKEVSDTVRRLLS